MAQFYDGDRPRSVLTAALHHLKLGSPDPSRLASFYDEALNYETQQIDGAIVARAANRHLIFSEGKAGSLIGVGYELRDAGELERLRQRINDAGWPRDDGPTLLFSDAVEVRDPDGTLFSFGLAQSEFALNVAADQRPARLQHVVVASRRPDRIVHFFTDVLGFTLSDNVVDSEGDIRTSFLRCSEEHHSFAVFKAAENRFDHHCYETTDWNLIRDWCDHIAKRDITIKWGPGRHGPGNNLFFFIHDPDGNWVEVSAELETVHHDRPAGTWPHEERTLNIWGQGLLRS